MRFRIFITTFILGISFLFFPILVKAEQCCRNKNTGEVFVMQQNICNMNENYEYVGIHPDCSSLNAGIGSSDCLICTDKNNNLVINCQCGFPSDAAIQLAAERQESVEGVRCFFQKRDECADSALRVIGNPKVFCFCHSDLESKSLFEEKNRSDAIQIINDCSEIRSDQCINKENSVCSPFSSFEECNNYKNLFLIQKEKALAGFIKEGQSATQSAIIPNCGLYNALTEECRDITIFIYLLLNVADYLFGIVGALVLLVFIIGGFQLIISQGEPEKIKKGTQTMLGAVIGLVIVFGAYALVNFLGKAVGLEESLKLF